MRRLTMTVALLVMSVSTLANAKPPAKLSDMAWLEGAWEGEGIGGAPVVEVYSAPAGGQMPGHFRQLNPDGTVMFYELITLVEEDGSLSFRLKHFDRTLVGWEEKQDVREFPLTAVVGNRWEFSGLTYERLDSSRMKVTVRVSGANGAAETLTFHFRKRLRQ